MKGMFRHFMASSFALSLAACVETQAQLNVQGQWSAVQNWPVVSVHTVLLPTGKVMFYPYSDETREWDPADGSLRLLSRAGYNTFCTGHSYLSDGRLLITGGHIANSRGLPNASYYDPFRDAWTRLSDMNDGRWYPSSTTLGNGDVLVTSGSRSGGGVNELPQVWQVDANSWRNLNNAVLQLPLYPRQFLAPNGRVFFATYISRYLDTAGNGAWSTVATRIAPGRDNYGSACLYDNGKVLYAGGGDPPLASCEVIDLNASQPAWRSVGSMQFPRRQHNLTILPDGQILATGGSSGAGFDNINAPVLPVELWNPVTETWTTLASAARYRGYHSIALLLPDGRVLSAGGDYELNAEVYSPPYLFKGARPAVSAAPTAVRYGESFFVGSPDAAGVAAVHCIRLSTVTHGHNMDQRINRLAFSQAGSGLNAVAPSNPNLCPPGYYMLFLLNGNGVPSVARIIRISSEGVAANLPPTVTLTAPPDQSQWTSPADIQLRADATDPESALSQVEFFANGTRLAQDTTEPYEHLWSGVPAGTYDLRAVATDAQGLSATSAVVRIVVSAPNTGGCQKFITGAALGRVRSDYNGWVGMRFTVGTQNLTVSELGRIYVAGNQQQHRLRLLRESDRQEVASTTVAMAGGVAGQFKYAALPAPVTLEAGRSYYLISEERVGGDAWHDLETRVQTTAAARCDGGVYQAGSSWYPVGFASQSYVPVDFCHGNGTTTTYSIAATVSPSGAGTVTGAGSYPAGASVSLAATANSGYAFAHWLENGNVTSTQNPYAFTAAANRSLAAVFTNVPTTYSITASALPFEAGETTGSGVYSAGAQVTVTATANDGYRFIHWTENGAVVSSNPIYTFIANQSRRLDANLEVIPDEPPGDDPPPAQALPWVTQIVPGRVRNDYNGWVGQQLIVGSDQISVSALGRYCLEGNTATHAVKLVDAANGADVPGGGVAVSMAGGIPGQFVFAPLPQAVVLPANRRYYLVSEERAGGDTWLDYYHTRLTVTAVASCPGAVYLAGYGWVAVARPESGYGPLNFQYAANASRPSTLPASATAGLISHWAFDEGSGGIATDSAGPNAGSLHNGAAWVGGRQNGALRFDGVNDYVNIPHHASLDLSNAFTISLWFQPSERINASSPRFDLLKKEAAYWILFNYPQRDGKLVFALNGGIPIAKSATADWPAAQWVHVGAVHDEASMRIYINGRLEGAVATAIVPANSKVPVEIGGNSDQGIYFRGAMDEVRIYGRALSAAEIASLAAEQGN